MDNKDIITVMRIYHITRKGAIKGLKILESESFGGCYQGSEIFVFPVPENWDGHKFSGYFKPSLLEKALCGVGSEWWKQFKGGKACAV